eukprot:1634064-Pleurochrysis_carterae.AAC.3
MESIRLGVVRLCVCVSKSSEAASPSKVWRSSDACTRVNDKRSDFAAAPASLTTRQHASSYFPQTLGIVFPRTCSTVASRVSDAADCSKFSLQG